MILQVEISKSNPAWYCGGFGETCGLAAIQVLEIVRKYWLIDCWMFFCSTASLMYLKYFEMTGLLRERCPQPAWWYQCDENKIAWF